MKTIGAILVTLGVLFTRFWIYQAVVSEYNYTSKDLSYWNLADKASTIDQKSTYIDEFVTALQSSGFAGMNSKLFFPTPDSSCDSNMTTLETLQSRLHDIKTMDENSFQYQSAIQQITAQEQGQADDMLNVLQSCYMRANYPLLWNPLLGLAAFVILLVVFVLGGGLIAVAD
jgi:hypothetical protein